MPEAQNNPNPKPAAQIQGMSNEQVAELLTGLIKAMKEPSDEEKALKAEAAERRKEMVRQAKLTAEQEVQNRMAWMAQCNHRNERLHTFVAQVCGNGDAVAICQICRKDYKWHATADQVRQGLNLIEFPGLKEEHLLAYEKMYPPVGEPPDRIKLLTRAGRPAA